MNRQSLSSLALRRFLLGALVLLSSALGPVSGQVVMDDFNDGNDAGWTRSNPLQPVGGTATWSFPNGNSYRIVPNPSPDPGTFGPGRAGSFRVDANYTNSFYVSVDLINWNNTIEQDAGILAFINTPGLGTLGSYAFSYDVDAGMWFLSSLVAEAASSLGSFDALLDPINNYRIVFQGYKGQMRGEVFFLDPDFELSLGVVTANDLTYTSGPCGLFNAHGVQDGAGISDATFDNYFSCPDTDVDADGMTDQWEEDTFGDLFALGTEDEDIDGQDNVTEFIGGSDPTDPGSLFSLEPVVTLEGGNIKLTFPLMDKRAYGLETSTDLENWDPQPGAVFADLGATGSLSLPSGGQSPLFGRVVIRVAK